VSASRLKGRRSLLEQFDGLRRGLDAAAQADAFDHYQQTAFSLLTTSRLREALDLAREQPAVRESYGMTLFGQACLTLETFPEDRLTTLKKQDDSR
jgi:hypothetical protein